MLTLQEFSKELAAQCELKASTVSAAATLLAHIDQGVEREEEEEEEEEEAGLVSGRLGRVEQLWSLLHTELADVRSALHQVGELARWLAAPPPPHPSGYHDDVTGC